MQAQRPWLRSESTIRFDSGIGWDGLARLCFAIPFEDFYEPSKWPASGSCANDCRSETRIRALAGRLLRRRVDGRDSSPMEANCWACRAATGDLQPVGLLEL